PSPRRTRFRLLRGLIFCFFVERCFGPVENYWGNDYGSVDKCWGHKNKNIKKQPFSDASASHLSLVLGHV
ncbi:MAG: hypothetical protein PUI23_01075, partial [Bacteroidales bacterium]|nr:hypothetical protein [Bacteroidales bacterium]MDY5225932.1 hypothetical protein [Sodaliphilus sp.]